MIYQYKIYLSDANKPLDISAFCFYEPDTAIDTMCMHISFIQIHRSARYPIGTLHIHIDILFICTIYPEAYIIDVPMATVARSPGSQQLRLCHCSVPCLRG